MWDVGHGQAAISSRRQNPTVMDFLELNNAQIQTFNPSRPHTATPP